MESKIIVLIFLVYHYTTRLARPPFYLSLTDNMLYRVSPSITRTFTHKTDVSSLKLSPNQDPFVLDFGFVLDGNNFRGQIRLIQIKYRKSDLLDGAFLDFF